jgi:hypothetical protein
MDIRLTKLEALIPTLATREDLLNTKIEMREDLLKTKNELREDLLKTRGRLEVSIQKLETAMHSEMSKQTWMFIKWMTGLLVTLLPFLIAATFYIARYIN